MPAFNIKRLDPAAVVPKRHTDHDAGIDIYTNETRELQPGETHAFTTGIATEFPAGYVALVWDRSSMGAKGIHMFGGVIDAGYRGEWKVLLHNATDKPVTITKGDRIAQAILQQYEPAEITLVDELSGSARGAKGFGSSGK